MNNKKQTFQHAGNYVCECGREFSKSQSYNAHLSHCKIHLGDTKYNARLVQQRNSFKLANIQKSKIKTELREAKHNELSNNWASTLHYCERCGKLLPNNINDVYGSGRFCSISCANSHDMTDDRLKKICLNSNINNKSARSLNG